MAGFLGHRLLVAVATLVASLIGVSVLIHLVPGDPVLVMMSQGSPATPEQIERMRHALGLDQPLWKQIIAYMGNALSGDLGRSIFGHEPVAELVFDRLPNTIALAVSGMVIAILIGMPLGFYAAYRHNTWIDTALMSVAVLGVSVPSFWLGLVLLLFFSLTLGWMPVATGDYRSLPLPALTLGLFYSAVIARMTRSAMVEILSEDFIRTARAKGLPEIIVLCRHALRPASIAVATIIMVVFGYIMGGAVVVENVFSWNGLGRLALEAILRRDYPVIQGFVLVFAAMIVVLTVLIDLVYVWLDPRISHK